MLENFEISQKMIVKVGDCIPIPVDTGRKLNVHKTFRRPPGCLLNVLRTRSIYVLFLRGYGFFCLFHCMLNNSIMPKFAFKILSFKQRC